MSRYYRNYESEISAFLRELKQEHPEIEQHQREGRRLLWEKPPLSPDELKREMNPEVKLKPYIYE
jgi:hypothetical protein